MPVLSPKKGQTTESTTHEGGKSFIKRLSSKKPSQNLSKDAEESPESTSITSLHLAAEDGNIGNVEQELDLLSDQFKIDSQTHEGMTALAIAAENESADVVRSLLKRNPALELRNKNGMTALHLAAQNGNEDIVRQLLLAGTFKKTSETSGASAPLQKDQKSRVNAVGGSIISNVDVLDKNSRTPLFLASERGNVSVVKLLLDSGADYRLSDKRGRMPIEAAGLAGKKEVIELLKLSSGKGGKSASSMGHWIRLSSDKNLDLGMIVADRETMQQVGTGVTRSVKPETITSPGFRATLDEVNKGHYGVWAEFLRLRLADRIGKEADNSLQVEAFEVTFFTPSEEYLKSTLKEIDLKFRESVVYMVTGTRVARLGSAKASNPGEQQNPSTSILLAVRLHEISPKKSLFSGRRTKT